MTHTTLYRFLPIAVTAALAGCASMNLNTSVPWAKKDKPQETRPQRMVAIWTDTVLHTAGKPSMRGFGGRIYFYDDKSKAVPVEGTLVVYAFDDSKGGLAREPDKKYVFKSEDFVRHADETALGQSYSVWLPWDQLGGERTQITLIPLFTTKDGEVLAGQQSKHILHGREPVSPMQFGPAMTDAGVRQASYMSSADAVGGASQYGLDHDANSAEARRLRSVSIPMTDTLKQRLIEAQLEASIAPNSSPEAATSRGPSLRTTGNGALGASAVPSAGGASLRPSRTTSDAPTLDSSMHRVQRPGDVYEIEKARIAAALEAAQTGQQQAARGGANRDPRFLQQSARFSRQRSPVPGATAGTPFPGPSPWQPSLEPPQFGPPASLAATPPGSLPADASTAAPLAH